MGCFLISFCLGNTAFRIGGRTVVSRPGLEAWVQEQEGNYAAKK